MTNFASCYNEEADSYFKETIAPQRHPMLGVPSKRHAYTNDLGVTVATVFRYDKSDKSAKKEFRPFCHYCQRWHAPDIRPLYYAKALKDTAGPVLVVEGENCADALNSLGILATTVFGSAGGIGKADFAPLKDRDVIIWPDNDEPGCKFANGVALSLRECGAATVRVIPVEALKDKPSTWDAADAINDGWNRMDVIKLIETAITLKASEALRVPECFRSTWDVLKDADAFKGMAPFKEPANDAVDVSFQDIIQEWGEPDMSILNPRPKPPEFPTYLFGPFWAKWLTRQAKGKSTPVDYVGSTLLVCASTIIGNARWVSPWESWKEPPHLWAALVGKPSSGKSPGMDPVLDLIRKIEAEQAEGHVEALRQFEANSIAAKHIRDEWEKDVKAAASEGYPPPAKPDRAIEPLRPSRPRIRVSDATPEALMNVIAGQPKGVVSVRDELSGWLGSFNRYSGGDGGDRAFWLEAWGGRPYVIDRVKNGEPITISNLSASVLGGIQPDKLASTLLKGDDDGLTARFMYFWPDPVPQERPEEFYESNDALNAFKALYRLGMATDDHGNAVPVTVPLTEEAAAFFHEWRVMHRDNESDSALLSWWGKMPGVCLRLAITFEGLWNSAEGKLLGHVSKAAIEAATVMIDDYLKPMAARAFGNSVLTNKECNAAILAKRILKMGLDRINTREISRGSGTPTLRKADDIRAAIDLLEETDWLRSDSCRSGGNNGRGSGDYKVNPYILEMG